MWEIDLVDLRTRGGTFGYLAASLHAARSAQQRSFHPEPLSSLAAPVSNKLYLAGTAEGSVVLFAPDPRRRITTRFNLAA